ncbi:MAG: hypothetical protein MJK04_12285, partial [Psychrosphaera sp.]|nr:hypothetical protein [Psychrosphaera sp.]
ILLLLAIGSAPLRAADPLVVRQLTVEDGLSQSTIYDIYQDHYGFIWMGSENGINRYDGHEFTQFDVPENADVAITQTKISSINEDIFKQLWIGTDEGIAIYDPLNNKFSYFAPKKHKDTGLVSDNISKIVRHSNGTMWVATYGGLHHYSYEEKRFTVHKIPDEIAKDANEIVTLIETPDGKLLLGTQSKGTLLFDPKEQRFSVFHYLADKPDDLKNEVRALFFDSRQKLWIGTNQGLLQYDYEQGKQTRNVLEELKLPNMQRQRIRSINEDTQGFIWVSIYGDGILSLNPRTNEYRLYGYVPAVRHGLNGNAVRKLYFDTSGLLWIGTEGYGVNIWNPISSAFGHITHQINNDNSLTDNVVWTIETDIRQNIWVGTDRGLNKISPDKKTVTRYLTDNTDQQPLASDLIYNLFFDRQTDHLWIATDQGVSRLHTLTQEVMTLKHDPKDTNTLSDDLVYNIELDSQRQLWFATNAGLDRLDLKTNKMYHYLYSPDDPYSLTKNTSVSNLFVDANDTLWVGTDNGVNRYNPKNDNFDRFLYHQGASYNADFTFISSIAEVKRGVLWFGYSGNGIATLDFSADISEDKTDPKKGHIGINDGLPTNIVFGIIPDHFGRAWISTMNGLLLYDMNGFN